MKQEHTAKVATFVERVDVVVISDTDSDTDTIPPDSDAGTDLLPCPGKIENCFPKMNLNGGSYLLFANVKSFQ